MRGDVTGRRPTFARGPRTMGSFSGRRLLLTVGDVGTRATFENSPPIGATLTSVTLADVGTRALRRSTCRRTQRRRGRPRSSRQPTPTRLQEYEGCPSSRVQRPEWGAARGATTPKSGVMVEPGPIERATRSILL